MKKILLIVLLLSFGFSQKLTEVVETYENGNIKSIIYHKKYQTEIKIVKYEGWYDGMRMDRRRKKKLTRMENWLNQNVGMKMEMKKSVDNLPKGFKQVRSKWKN